MTTHLNNYISIHLPARTTPLVIMSDIDELPSRHTISLLRTCAFGTSLHLLLRNFLYSFEWYLGHLSTSWRASVQEFRRMERGGGGTTYRHSKVSDVALADAGWHCSFCFRTLPEYVVKMRGYSHADRIGGDEGLLDVDKIQEKICRGEDIFGMLPEAYSVSRVKFLFLPFRVKDKDRRLC
jgi:beta-1,4-mannosyl-glycoprotein beta-1,4-N-acetylglucosaminyltransferase